MENELFLNYLSRKDAKAQRIRIGGLYDPSREPFREPFRVRHQNSIYP